MNGKNRKAKALQPSPVGRRRFLSGIGRAGIGVVGAGMLAGCGGIDYSQSKATPSEDAEILNAAKIAEALAVTVHTQIINSAPFFTRLLAADQGFFRAAREEDMLHYQLLKNATGGLPTSVTEFYLPVGMFTNAKVTLDTVVTLEDAFIAAYLIGVRDFSTPPSRLIAARILGVQSDHRSLARAMASRVTAADGGPFTTLKGLSGQEEPVDPPSNNAYERTFHLTSIQDAVTALKPFIDLAAATSKGFDTSRSFTFEPFTPTPPSTLGDING